MRSRTQQLFASLAVAVMTLVVSINPVSAAETLYGTTGSGGAASSLYRIDPTTGASTLVGAIGFNEVVSIDFNPITGTLYGIANNGGGSKSLITISTSTGVGSFVAGLSPSFQSPDMSFGPTGTLYSWSEPFPDNLNTVNIVTGATTEIGPSGVSTLATGLDVRSDGTIFMKSANNMYTVDATTGAATYLFSLAGPSFENVLAFNTVDKLYTVDRYSGNSDLYSIDLTTQSATLIGATGLSSLGALAFVPNFEVTSPVPEPETYAMLLAGLGMLGFMARRRKQKEAVAA